MSEAQRPKYDSLPGIDTAPDVYETPDLVEDASTIQASTAVSESDGESDVDESGVRHQRLQTDQARSRFQPARVDARDVDFSDNITAQGRSYRTSTRGQRRRGEVLGDDSGDEKESFSRKLLRVKKELHELEHEYEGRLQSGDKTKIEERDPKEIMEFISDTVDKIYAMRRGGVRGAEPLLTRTIDKFNNYPPFGPSPRISKAIERQPPLPGTQIQRSQLDFVLNQAADFDHRLTNLERSLGLNGNTMPDLAEKAPFPIFPTLEKLEQTIGTMADASSGNLDAAAQQIKKMIADAEQLKQLRQEDSGATLGSSDIKSPQASEQESKVNALYGTLPAIDKLTPILPLVLDRLRTLRLVHTSAWQADEVLTELEHRQSKQEEELKKWEASLETQLINVKVCEQGLQNNMKVVGDWVKRIEDKVDNLVEESNEQEAEEE
ncbi:Dynamitin-domain-containing protein [Clohesyomyces aquaticus]|uniref:Dynamitin-domain-containing protein n=1 Tax=Clohesyomyces aquaticus TaxID=1231657 RepID=A0A1Y2ABI3_9PLEO|nr:Dynamitin-domain-containing protein [Clohesyomyces aquaticus]